MRTLVISDLHLGAASGRDLLRRAELRAPLIEALDGVDRLVVLGDGLELREAPHRDAAELAAPLFAEAGAALGRDGELLVLAGNHDHGLVAGWIDARLQSEPSGFLGLSEPVEPAAAGRLAQRLEQLAAPARLRLAYPGAWLREDVYALHGHYVDLHSTVPTFERLAAGAMARWVVRMPERGARPDDYEAALAPLYAFLHQLTQRSDHSTISAGAGASARAWVAMAGRGAGATPCGRRRWAPATSPRWPRSTRSGSARSTATCRARHCGAAACAASARSSGGSGSARRTCCSDTRTAPARGRATTRATGSPRPGPGSSTPALDYQPHFLSERPNASPYWPGTAVVVDDDGPPRLIRLLGDRGHAELRPPG